jgi:hypothetical protein
MPGTTHHLDTTLTRKSSALAYLKVTGATKTPKALVGCAKARLLLGVQRWKIGRYAFLLGIYSAASEAVCIGRRTRAETNQATPAPRAEVAVTTNPPTPGTNTVTPASFALPCTKFLPWQLYIFRDGQVDNTHVPLESVG